MHESMLFYFNAIHKLTTSLYQLLIEFKIVAASVSFVAIKNPNGYFYPDNGAKRESTKKSTCYIRVIINP